MTNLELLQEWYRRVWIEGDLAAIDDYFAPQGGAEGILADGQVGAEDFRALVPTLLALIRDLRIDMVRSFETDDWVWAQLSVHGYTAHGVDRIAATGQVAARISDGRIIEAYNGFDFISFFEQIGLLPKDAFLLLLSGERFALA